MDAISQLKSSAKSGKLVAVVGTGVSMSLTDSNPTLSWKGLGELRKLGINLAQSTVSIYMVPSRAGRCRAKKRSFAIVGKL
jgi:hypothetical protein